MTSVSISVRVPDRGGELLHRFSSSSSCIAGPYGPVVALARELRLLFGGISQLASDNGLGRSARLWARSREDKRGGGGGGGRRGELKAFELKVLLADTPSGILPETAPSIVVSSIAGPVGPAPAAATFLGPCRTPADVPWILSTSLWVVGEPQPRAWDPELGIGSDPARKKRF